MDNLHRQHEWATLYPYQPVIPEFGVVAEEAWPCRKGYSFTDLAAAINRFIETGSALPQPVDPTNPWSEVK